MRGSLHQYYHTVRHFQPIQLWRWLGILTRNRLGLPRIPDPPEKLCGRLESKVPFRPHDPWNDPGNLRKGRFRFLNESFDLGWPPNWGAPGQSLLWRFNLHYFHYLHLLDQDSQQEVCRDWILANPPRTAVAWHPYPASLRVVNWCKAGFAEQELLKSLYRQSAYVYRTTEDHIPGNHLLENARALVLAGTFFDGQGESPAWMSRGLEIYRRQTPTQLMEDGGYFERSPMYHALVLEGYLDVLNVLPVGHRDRLLFAEAVGRMCDFLLAMTHPSGHITLFSDSTQEVALPTSELLSYARALVEHQVKARDVFAQSGYFVHAGSTLYLAIDGGPIGPDHLPAHGHADIFSYELSIKGQPAIVDSGVYEYAPGVMRAYSRSTRAHNTVTVDGVDQAEFWGSFRVARRFAPHAVSFAREGAISRFTGCFDGYAHLIGDGILHRRDVTVDESKRTVEVEDRIEGAGIHRVESRVHLHPDLKVTVDGRMARLSRDSMVFTLVASGHDFVSEKGWYCPEFGIRQTRSVLVLGGRCELPVRIAYRIEY